MIELKISDYKIVPHSLVLRMNNKKFHKLSNRIIDKHFWKSNKSISPAKNGKIEANLKQHIEIKTETK